MRELETLKEGIERSFKKYSSKTSIKYYKQKYSFTDLRRLSNKAINYMNNLGLKYNDKIAILSKNIPPFAIINIAALRMGITVIPINYLLSYDEVEYIIKDSGVKVLFIQESFAVKMEGLVTQNILDSMILLDKGEGYPVLNDELENCSDSNMDITYPVKFNDTAIIIYTSGTTGRPKGVMLSHRNIFSNVKDVIEVTRVSHKERLFTLLPLFHAYSYTITFILPLIWGIKMIFMDDLSNGKLIIKTMVKERITWLVAIPTLFNAIAKANLPKIFRYISPLKVCVSGAAPLPPSTNILFKEKMGLNIYEGYGLSECSPVAALNDPNAPVIIGSVGQPMPSNSIKIIDDDENELAVGEVGEIIIKGPNIMLGYYNLPEETAKSIKNEWFFSGDFGKFDKDGNLYIVGRKKELIIRNGMNIYPPEIERVIMLEMNVKECAVIGHEVTEGVEVPIAFYETIDKKEIPANILRNLCKLHLAAYKMPQKFIFMQELPKTPTGKPIKRKLKVV